MVRLTINLSDGEWAALQAVAVRELRTVKEQARLVIRKAVLPAESGNGATASGAAARPAEEARDAAPV